MRKILAMLLLVMLLSFISNAQTGRVSVEYFYDPACPKCAKALPVIESAVNSYGDKVVFTKYNVLTDEGLELAKKYQLPGVPSVIIDRDKDKNISYEDYNGDAAKLEALLKQAIDTGITSAASKVPDGGYMRSLEIRLRGSIDRGISWKEILFFIPLILVAGVIAGFNPCLLAILAFIASVTLAATGKKRNVFLIVLMFSLGIFATYLVSGIFLLKIFEESPSLESSIRIIIVTLIGLLGLWHVYDAYHLQKNKESSFYTPKAFIHMTESITKKVSLPASFFMGALFSLIKAPCILGVYFVILDMVRSGEGAGLLYLAVYNLGVVLPVLVLGAAIALGLNPEKVENFRKEKRVALRLITGVTLLVIAVLMYAGII